MDGYIASAGAVGSAARGVETLATRVETFHRATGDATRALSPEHVWGLLRSLRQDFLSLAAEFEQHLDHMSGAIDGAKKRLHATGTHYSSAETACLRVLAKVGDEYGDGRRLRQLNPASRFYQDHRAWNGVITSLPMAAGTLGSAALHTWRFFGDLDSDDKYNIGTDIALLVTDASAAFLAVRSNYANIIADPIGFLARGGVSFLLNAFYWTKTVADRLTGDPIATGQAAYNFDSIAQGCRKLATDLDETMHRTLGETWQGIAADTARQRLTEVRDGIADTAGSADRTAALLQLVSSLITDVEAIIRGMISEVVVWAVVAWLSAQLAAAETLGASELAAAQRITAESSRTAGDVGRVMTVLAGMLRRVSGLVRRLRAELRQIKAKSFTALLRSTPGRKFMESGYGGGRQTLSRVRADATGKHARINDFHVFVSTGKQTGRSAKNGVLRNFGFNQYWTDPSGKPYPFDQRKIRVLSYQVPDGQGGTRALNNYVGVAGSAASTVLPFGRAAQYWARGGDTAPGSDIDRELDLWETPA
ncbi:hypothetical protein [Actinoallomurus iriomotensis]|uniref:WXG100 family type VII secretion target n=1 Tax=Actinoallomurus iriomotensis TaxID=478107 RepID=A0A9W6RBS0_9ACTN|nr:hypothetical protein [Actinoallomurus iriomotensis]GLY72926.1 hypothetical protein Airi01_011930 [Actinoallomurus iriomotensis]